MRNVVAVRSTWLALGVAFASMALGQGPLPTQLEDDITFSLPPHWNIENITILPSGESDDGAFSYEFQAVVSASSDLYRLEQDAASSRMNAIRVATTGETIRVPGRIQSSESGDTWRNEIVFRAFVQQVAGVPLDRFPQAAIAIDSGIHGHVGLMNVDLIDRSDARSSFGLPYETDLRICEMNLQAGRWLNLPRPPFFLDFLHLTSNATGNETHCIVMGTFGDANHPERVLLVAPLVMQELDPSVYGEAEVTVRLWSPSERTDEARRLAQIYELPRGEDD